MKFKSQLLYLIFFIYCALLSAQISPPLSISGTQIEYSTGGDITTSIPYQEFYGDDGTVDYGFSNSILVSGSYSYSNGVISVPAYGMETRLTFIGGNSGTYESYDIYPNGEELVDSGTFVSVTPSLEEKVDWKRSETFDAPLSSAYWQVWQRSVDSLAYNDGELSFVFGSSDANSSSDTEIPYARKIPMNEDWQVVLSDIYAAPALNNFEIELEIKALLPSGEFSCQICFKDDGSGRQFRVDLEQQVSTGSEYASAYVGASEDTRISSGGSLRVVHLASSRDIILEYQPDGANEWSELASLNLVTGAFLGQYNSMGSNLTGDIISATNNKMSAEIEAEAGVETQVSDLEIGGVEIGSYNETNRELADALAKLAVANNALAEAIAERDQLADALVVSEALRADALVQIAALQHRIAEIENPIDEVDPQLWELAAELAAVKRERDARPTQEAYDTVIAERDARLTESQVRDLRLGSSMLEAVDGNASINIELEATDNLGITNPTWTPVPESKVVIHPNFQSGKIKIDVEADDESNSGVRFYRFKLDD